MKKKKKKRKERKEGLKCAVNITGGPSSLQERGRDSCLQAMLCYKRLFRKACMGCKLFLLKEGKDYVFK